MVGCINTLVYQLPNLKKKSKNFSNAWECLDVVSITYYTSTYIVGIWRFLLQDSVFACGLVVGKYIGGWRLWSHVHILTLSVCPKVYLLCYRQYQRSPQLYSDHSPDLCRDMWLIKSYGLRPQVNMAASDREYGFLWLQRCCCLWQQPTVAASGRKSQRSS